MGTFVFKWPHQADEVYVTGTFDDWGKSVQLEKKGDIFEKEVTLPKADEKILYKFVVGDKWIIDHEAPQEGEGAYINNVLYPHDIKKPSAGAAMLSGVTPQSTTAGLAGDVPREESKETSEGPGTATISSAAPDSTTADLAKDVPLEKTGTSGSSALPGSFPETPANEPESFSVNPIPATSGIGNPVQLAPGEKVPDPSTLTSNTVNSTATTDQESYEKGAETVPASMSKEEEDSGAFSVPPVSKDMIPESSLPISEGETKALETTDTGPTIQSAAPDSTTAALAGAVPKEPRGEATVVDDTPTEPSATTNGESKPAEGESKKEEAGIIAGTGAAVAAGGAAVASAVGSKTDGPSSPIADDVPETVKESITKSKSDPEAAANPEAVEEKKEMEAELLKEVKEEEGTGESAPTGATSDPRTTLKAPDAAPRHQSRDLSPHSRPAVAPGSKPAETPATETPTTTTTPKPTSATTTPAKSTNDATPTKDKKKKNRASGFFGKLKEKFK